MKETLGLEHLEPRRPILPLIGLLDLAAEKMAGELHPVADAQDRNPEVEHPRVDTRRPVGKHTRRPATQNDRPRRDVPNLSQRIGAGLNLTIDVLLPNPPSNELGVLRPEVENQNPINDHGADLTWGFGGVEGGSGGTGGVTGPGPVPRPRPGGRDRAGPRDRRGTGAETGLRGRRDGDWDGHGCMPEVHVTRAVAENGLERRVTHGSRSRNRAGAVRARRAFAFARRDTTYARQYAAVT